MAANDKPFSLVSLTLLLYGLCHGSDINKEVVNGSGLDEKIYEAPKVAEDKSWAGFPDLGQVSAVAVDGDGNLHIFHRCHRVWDSQSFDRNNQLKDVSRGPIDNDTVLVVDSDTGKILYSWGSNRFHMPHGLTVDRQGNTWITDVGLHQVFKFSARDNVPLLELGEAFVPGNDHAHFCKPTDVAVASSGYFYVSDGYCNSRILLFSQGGRLLKEIGSRDGMTIPHSLSLVPEHGAICVADRESERILCYSSGMDGTVPGVPLAGFSGEGLARVFAIDKRGEQLFAVNGPPLQSAGQSTAAQRGVIVDIETGSARALWGPDGGFLEPHDLAVSPDGKLVFVAEIGASAPKKVYKFIIAD